MRRLLKVERWDAIAIASLLAVLAVGGWILWKENAIFDRMDGNRDFRKSVLQGQGRIEQRLDGIDKKLDPIQ